MRNLISLNYIGKEVYAEVGYIHIKEYDRY